MLELGSLIRERRKAMGLTHEDVAARIKVSSRALAAIEEGSLSGLPHAIYARGFVKSYGLAVGIDAAELGAMLDQAFPSEVLGNIHPELGPAAREQAMTPRMGIGRVIVPLVILFLLALLGYGGWVVFDRYGEDIWNLVKKPFTASSVGNGEGQNATEPDRTAPAATSSAPAERIPPRSTSATSVPDLPLRQVEPPQGAMQAEALPDAAPRQAERLNATAVAPSAPANAAAQIPQTAAGQNATAARNATVAASARESDEAAEALDTDVNSLLITASANCWIKSRADGAEGRRFTLTAGESSALSFKKQLVLTLGNAGGVTIRYNGKDYPVAGKPGEVKTLIFPPGR